MSLHFKGSRMFNRSSRLLPVAALLVGLLSNSARANIIDETYGAGAGGFELGNFVDNGIGFMALSPDDTTIAGWTVGGPGNGIDWLTSPEFAADTGIHSVDLQELSNSSISTVIPTVPGSIYDLTFAATSVIDSNANGLVSAGNLVQASFITGLSPSYETQSFSTFRFQFVALSDQTTVTFEATGAELPLCAALIRCYGPVVDSVVVTAAPIPEPATYLLFGAALIPFSLVVAGRRKRDGA